MSTYDMYFSKQNKNYMFSTLSTLILQETGYDIKNDPNYIELYRLYYPSVFDTIDTDELSVVNKHLINTIGEIILKRLKNPQQFIQQKSENEVKEFIKPKTKTITNIYSIQRSKESKNRFNFKIKLKEFHETETKSFLPKTITLLKEQNSLFSNDTIFIRFNDCDNLSFILKDKKYIGEDEYYTYECLTDDTISSKDKLHIQIFNYLMMSPCDKNDIFKIMKLKKITYENDIYTCLQIKNHDFKINQELGLLQNDKLEKTVFIKHIFDEYILTDYKDYKDINSCLKMNQNISMKILIFKNI